MGIASGLCHMEEEVFKLKKNTALWDLLLKEIIKSTRCDNCDPFSSCLLTQTMALQPPATRRTAWLTAVPRGPERLASGGAASAAFATGGGALLSGVTGFPAPELGLWAHRCQQLWLLGLAGLGSRAVGARA